MFLNSKKRYGKKKSVRFYTSTYIRNDSIFHFGNTFYVIRAVRNKSSQTYRNIHIYELYVYTQPKLIILKINLKITKRIEVTEEFFWSKTMTGMKIISFSIKVKYSTVQTVIVVIAFPKFFYFFQIRRFRNKYIFKCCDTDILSDRNFLPCE